MPRRYFLLIGLILVVYLIVSIVIAYRGGLTQPDYTWFVLFAMLYGAPGLGNAAMASEFREDNVFWWLSLPASRERLVMAKWLATVLRYGKVWLMIFAYACVYLAALDLGHGYLSVQTFAQQVQVGLIAGLFVVLFIPFLVIVGMLMGILQRMESPLVGAAFTAIMWILIVNAVNFQFSMMSINTKGHIVSLRPGFNLNYPWLLLEVILAWILTGIIYKFIVARLKRCDFKERRYRR